MKTALVSIGLIDKRKRVTYFEEEDVKYLLDLRKRLKEKELENKGEGF